MKIIFISYDSKRMVLKPIERDNYAYRHETYDINGMLHVYSYYRLLCRYGTSIDKLEYMYRPIIFQTRHLNKIHYRCNILPRNGQFYIISTGLNCLPSYLLGDRVPQLLAQLW